MIRHVFVAGLLAALVSGNVLAQDPSSLEAVSALQNSLERSIAAAEKSVVAIARVRKELPEDSVRLEFRPNSFSPLAAPVTPMDPNFVPNEYAAGVVVDSKGLILTAAHVLGDDGDSYYVTTSDRRVYRASIVAADPRSDLAVLAVLGSEANSANMAPIRLGDAAPLRKGQIVVALGNPYTIARDGQASAGWGIVANLGRKAPPSSDSAESPSEPLLYRHGGLIQTDVRLHLGTSGGPLLNLQGEMVGMCVSMAAVTGYESSAGYAIPVDAMFRRVLDVLKQGREAEYGFMGIHPSNHLAEAERADLFHHGRQGIHFHIEPGWPADRAGLRENDIITSVNDRPIYDFDVLVSIVGSMPVESVAHVGILRNDAPQTVDVVLSKFNVHGRKIVTVRPDAWRGIRVDYASAFLEPEQPLGLNVSADTVGISDVEPNSPAAQAGLKRGMFISQVDGRPIRTPREFRAAVAEKSGNVQLRLAAGDPLNSVLVVPGS